MIPTPWTSHEINGKGHTVRGFLADSKWLTQEVVS